MIIIYYKEHFSELGWVLVINYKILSILENIQQEILPATSSYISPPPFRMNNILYTLLGGHVGIPCMYTYLIFSGKRPIRSQNFTDGWTDRQMDARCLHDSISSQVQAQVWIQRYYQYKHHRYS